MDMVHLIVSLGKIPKKNEILWIYRKLLGRQHTNEHTDRRKRGKEIGVKTTQT